ALAVDLCPVRVAGHRPPLRAFPTRRSSDLVGLDGVFEFYTLQGPCLGVHGGVRELVGVHLAEALEAVDLYFRVGVASAHLGAYPDRRSTRLNSSHVSRSYAVFCLKQKPPGG